MSSRRSTQFTQLMRVKAIRTLWDPHHLLAHRWPRDLAHDPPLMPRHSFVLVLQLFAPAFWEAHHDSFCNHNFSFFAHRYTRWYCLRPQPVPTFGRPLMSGSNATTARPLTGPAASLATTLALRTAVLVSVPSRTPSSSTRPWVNNGSRSDAHKLLHCCFSAELVAHPRRGGSIGVCTTSLGGRCNLMNACGQLVTSTCTSTVL